MLQSIHIQNFRCFEDFKAEGFERINLIGGKNNSGKSCLLEGIFLAFKINYSTEIADLRNEKPDGLYRNYNNYNVNFRFEYQNKIFNSNIQGSKNNPDSNTNYVRVTTPPQINKYPLINFILQNAELPKPDTSKLEVIEFSNLKPEIIKILQIIDKRIIDVKIYFNTNNIDYKLLFKVNGKNDEVNLSSTGLATNKILQLFTPIIEKKARNDKDISLLLIDEIENGIHYIAHKEFWQHLFKLCKELNVQVFATTHSLEMIKTFNEVALQEGEAGYFEMMRDEANNNIEILKHSPKILEEELELKAPKFRGEEYKTSINLATDLLETLNQASAAAQEKLKANGIAVPYIEDGWIWQLLPDGTKEKIEKLEAIK